MKKPDERGVSAVEFALLLPLLVIVLFGIIEFGLILYDKAVITNASREGARRGIVYDSTVTPSRPLGSNIIAGVTPYNSQLISFASGTPAMNVTIATNNVANAACNATGDLLQVSVTYKYTFLVLSSSLPFSLGGFTGPNVTASTTMRCE
jgi:Flp pilus assembly protein TadG